MLIVQESPAIDSVLPVQVRLNDNEIMFDNENDSLSTSSGDDESIDSHADMPPLERRDPDLSSYSDSNLSLDGWSNSTFTTLDATLPDGVDLDPLVVQAVVPDLDILDVADTPMHGEDIERRHPPVPDTIEVVTTASADKAGPPITRSSRSGRLVQLPSRCRDTGLTTFERHDTYVYKTVLFK